MKKTYFYLLVMLLSMCFITYGNEQSTVSGKPRVVTTTKVTIIKNGQENVTEVSTSKLLTVQTTETTVIKQNGTTVRATTIGEVVGDVTHGRIAQKRVELPNEILQGTTIEINGDDILVNGEIARDVNGNKYSSSSIIGSIYDIYVHSVNRQPTTIVYNETDSIGSSNIVTYWINGKDTGISANLKITRTLVTATTTMSGTSIVKKQLFNEESLPSTIRFIVSNGFTGDGYIEEYIYQTYTLQTEGENAGYYVSSNGNIRFSAVLKRKDAATNSSEYENCPGYVAEFETKSGNTFRKRDDFVFFNSNSFSSIAYPCTKVLASESVGIGHAFGENVTVNAGEYYFIDDIFTGIVASDTDRITDSYTPVDPAAKNEEIAQTYIETFVTRNGLEVIRSLNLGAKNISSVTKNGKTITGELSYGDVIIATYGNQKAYGKTVIIKNGYVYFDGVNSGILESNASFETKTCYYVNGQPTDVERLESDSITNKTYYTDNGELTSIEKLSGDVIDTEEIEVPPETQIVEKVMKITANGTLYEASGATKVTDGYYLNLSLNSARPYYTTKSTYTDDVIQYNGTDIGRRSNATFYTVQVPVSSTGDGRMIYAIQGITPVQLVSDSNYSDTNTYLPQLDGYFFIVNGKMYHYNSNISSPLEPITISGYPYSSYTFHKTEGSFVLSTNSGYMYLSRFISYGGGTAFAADNTSYRLYNTVSYSSSYVNNTLLFLTFACINDVPRTRCISCFNDESNEFISMAGFQGWGRFSYGVHKTSRKLYHGTGHITSTASFGGLGSQTFNKIVMFDSSYSNGAYLALDTNNRVWLINGTSEAQILDIDNGASIIDIDANRLGRGVAISNNAIYVISLDGILKYATEYAPRDVVYGRSAVGVLTSDNRLWTADIPTSATQSTISWNLSPLRNVTDIGVVNNKVICRSTKLSEEYEDVAMVRINGVEYRQSDLNFEAGVNLYVLNGAKTMYRVSPNDTSSAVQSIRLTLTDNRGTTNIQESQITNVDTRVVSRAPDGGILGIITTENGRYYINGNDTGISVNVLDDIVLESRKTYYIGDVNTGIEPESNDDKIEIKGDYWEVNGHNTAVRYYGLGDMCVRISDVTPGEITEDDTASASTVVVPLVVRAQIVRFNENRPITSIKFQYRKLTDSNWTNLKELTNAKRKLETNGLQAIFGRYVEVPVSYNESFIVRVNISDGTESTVTASALEPEQGNVFYYSFIRSSKERVK